MAYQRRKRRFDRKKVVLVERTICILILLAGTCRTVDRRTAVKRRFAEKKADKDAD